MAKTYYGAISGNRSFTQALGVYASSVFKAKSGRFVYISSGYITPVADGGDNIMGAVDTVDLTAGSTSGDTKLPVDISTDTIYEIPIYHASGARTAAQLQAYVGLNCDIKVTANVQYADIATQTDDLLQIVGFDVDEQTVYVKINAAEQMHA